MYRCLSAAAVACRGVLRPLVVNNGHLVAATNQIQGHRSIMGASGSRSPQADFISETVKEHCVVIFSKTTCSYCRLAKRVFEDLGTPYHAVELNKRQDGPEMQEVLSQLTGDATVPRVFINGKCVGGGTETKALQNKGELVMLLQECANTPAQ